MKNKIVLISCSLGFVAAFAQSLPMYQFNFYANPGGGPPQVQGPVATPLTAAPAQSASVSPVSPETAVLIPPSQISPALTENGALSPASNINASEQVLSLQNKVEELSAQVDRFERWGFTTSGIYLSSAGSKDLTGDNKANSFAKFEALELARVGVFLPLGENLSIEPAVLGGRIIAEKRGCGQKYCRSENDTGLKQKGQIQGIDVEFGGRAYLPEAFPLYVKIGIRPTLMKGEVSNGWDKMMAVDSRGVQLSAGAGVKLGHLGVGIAYNYGVHEMTYTHTSSLKIRQALTGIEGKLSYTF